MENIKILKKLKIMYDNIYYILENYFNYQTNSKNINFFEQFAIKVEKTYDDLYKNTKKSELLSICKCPKCSKKLKISDIINYDYVCSYCDENFYSIEIKGA